MIIRLLSVLMFLLTILFEANRKRPISRDKNITKSLLLNELDNEDNQAGSDNTTDDISDKSGDQPTSEYEAE